MTGDGGPENDKWRCVLGVVGMSVILTDRFHRWNKLYILRSLQFSVRRLFSVTSQKRLRSWSRRRLLLSHFPLDHCPPPVFSWRWLTILSLTPRCVLILNTGMPRKQSMTLCSTKGRAQGKPHSLSDKTPAITRGRGTETRQLIRQDPGNHTRTPNWNLSVLTFSSMISTYIFPFHIHALICQFFSLKSLMCKPSLII